MFCAGALVWRVFWRGNRMALKILHGLIQFGALVFACLGLFAAFRAHDIEAQEETAAGEADGKRYHLTSLHSWAGLALVILFAIQWCGGLFLFIAAFQRARPLLGVVKRITRMLHVTAGAWFVVWIGAVIFMGIMEDATSYVFTCTVLVLNFIFGLFQKLHISFSAL